MPKVKEMVYLKATDIEEELRKRGINVSYRSILRYAQSGYIPGYFVKIERRGRKKLYFFKPEVVDFLTEKLLEKPL